MVLSRTSGILTPRPKPAVRRSRHHRRAVPVRRPVLALPLEVPTSSGPAIHEPADLDLPSAALGLGSGVRLETPDGLAAPERGGIGGVEHQEAGSFPLAAVLEHVLDGLDVRRGDGHFRERLLDPGHYFVGRVVRTRAGAVDFELPQVPHVDERLSEGHPQPVDVRERDRHLAHRAQLVQHGARRLERPPPGPRPLDPVCHRAEVPRVHVDAAEQRGHPERVERAARAGEGEERAAAAATGEDVHDHQDELGGEQRTGHRERVATKVGSGGRAARRARCITLPANCPAEARENALLPARIRFLSPFLHHGRALVRPHPRLLRLPLAQRPRFSRRPRKGHLRGLRHRALALHLLRRPQPPLHRVRGLPGPHARRAGRHPQEGPRHGHGGRAARVGGHRGRLVGPLHPAAGGGDDGGDGADRAGPARRRGKGRQGRQGGVVLWRHGGGRFQSGDTVLCLRTRGLEGGGGNRCGNW
ncbi:hypothetical protein DFJ74DRAFT_311683 [Hyaloraphidium curvatum]|nr:hypothetical protein DFJ74DRAFT_311683 [Hyaloraphidium curvatum]